MSIILFRFDMYLLPEEDSVARGDLLIHSPSQLSMLILAAIWHHINVGQHTS